LCGENGANDGTKQGCETINDIKIFQGKHLLEMDEYLLVGSFEWLFLHGKCGCFLG